MQKNASLTSQQIEHYECQGYLVCEQAFHATEIAALATAYGECLDALRTADRLYNIRQGQLAHTLFDD